MSHENVSNYESLYLYFDSGSIDRFCKHVLAGQVV